MLGKEYTRKTLERLIYSEAYIKAKNLDAIRKVAFTFLEHLGRNRLFKEEYDRTSKYYLSVNNTFEEIIKKYNMGDMLSALKLLKKYLVDKDGRIKLNREVLKEKTPLFRMRSQTGYHLYERENLFHIPTNKTNIIPSARYSINGFPCLYLGASLYVCWEETRRSDVEKVNYVKMIPTEDISFISTLCPDKFKNETDVIQFFIFALCTKKADNDNDKFQFQYVIPELLLSLLISNNGSEGEARGIKYVSARYFDKDNQFSLESIFYNYVIPVCKKDDENEKNHLSLELKKIFKVSEVKAFYVNRIYENKICLSRKTRPNEYENTHFWLLEQELKAKKHLKIEQEEEIKKDDEVF